MEVFLLKNVLGDCQKYEGYLTNVTCRFLEDYRKKYFA